jgi:hypothetical protein
VNDCKPLVLGSLVRRVLDDVKEQIPESAGYRKIVEATYQHRLDIIEVGRCRLSPSRPRVDVTALGISA